MTANDDRSQLATLRGLDADESRPLCECGRCNARVAVGVALDDRVAMMESRIAALERSVVELSRRLAALGRVPPPVRMRR